MRSQKQDFKNQNCEMILKIQRFFSIGLLTLIGRSLVWRQNRGGIPSLVHYFARHAFFGCFVGAAYA